VRLWINDQLVINNWTDHGAKTDSATISLTAGVKYNVKMEFYENKGKAIAQLQWSGPGFSKVVIPSTALVNSSNGLAGTYYNTLDLTGTPALQRLDNTVGFDWTSGSPDASINPDVFSARWTGKVKADATGIYTFYTSSDDGVRLWINGQLLINNWTIHAAVEDSASIGLVSGITYDVRVEYYENLGQATVKLLWAPPGGIKTIIPNGALRDR
jgi:hypothetical protein